jgi:hypothetical protein
VVRGDAAPVRVALRLLRSGAAPGSRVADRRCGTGVKGADMTTQDDPPGPTPKQAAAALERMERLSRLGAADAMWMQQRAAERRTHAVDLTARGDRIGAKYELAEAEELELDAADILDPLGHTTAPVQIGRGGELATGAAMMQPFLDTVRTRPDWLVHDASRERMELASNAGALTMGLDAVETIQARDSTEKMLMHQLAAAHSLGMRMVAGAGEQIAAYRNSGHQYPHRSIEACRMANAASRLMDVYQRGLLTLDRLRNGGQQMVTVQHVNVAAGGQAVVAGAVGTRNRGDGQE